MTVRPNPLSVIRSIPLWVGFKFAGVMIAFAVVGAGVCAAMPDGPRFRPSDRTGFAVTAVPASIAIAGEQQ